MNDVKTLSLDEMEKVTGGEAMEACESCDPAEAVAAGRKIERIKKYKKIIVNGQVKYVPYFYSRYVD